MKYFGVEERRVSGVVTPTKAIFMPPISFMSQGSKTSSPSLLKLQLM